MTQTFNNSSIKQAFNNILIRLTKSKKHVSITPDLHHFLIVPSKQRNHKLTGAREYVRIFNFDATTEAVAERCSVKKVFLEIFQNSQENTSMYHCILISLAYSFLCTLT